MRQYVKIRIAEGFPEFCGFSTTDNAGKALWEMPDHRVTGHVGPRRAPKKVAGAAASRM
jgi:hypothetical protein